jgi:glycosyltransferase involved in cell wall biosynthesis
MKKRFASDVRFKSLKKLFLLLTTELGCRIEASRVRASHLVDSDWYLKQWPDVREARMDPCYHFCRFGWQEKRSPNPYFDVTFYEAQMPERERGFLNPLLHYIRKGEKAGLKPVHYFDPTWYRTQYRLRKNQTALRHYLQHAASGKFSPIKEFDVEFYLETNADVRKAGVDPFLHCLNTRSSESRSPAGDIETAVSKYEGGWSREIKRFTSAGPVFEEFTPVGRRRPRQAKVLAYYLPQYHAIPENDEWWGNGFTEWTNLARGVPRFSGHYQPRIPRDLGFYNLLSPETLRRQIELARGAGLFGFVFYFYWFNQRRLLEKPLDAFVADTTLDFPFCLMWTNENWTRRWDGFDDQVLIAQTYKSEDEQTLIETFLGYFRDPRYIRIGNRPLLMLYRPGLIPEAKQVIQRWRKLFAEIGNENPIIIMGQGFGDTDPREFGLDGAIEFPPHKLLQELLQHPINNQLKVLDPEFTGHVYSYDAVVENSLRETHPRFPLIKTVFPSWDNDARRQGSGVTIHGSTPAAYENWLSELIKYAGRYPFMGEKFVCVSAWNEWAEGAYLEPDVHFGSAYLNATARAITGATADGSNRIVLVGHDAAPDGAQMILLNIIRVCVRRFGMDVEVVLLGGGPLLATYKEAAQTRICDDPAQMATLSREFYRRGFRYAVVNSSASAAAAPPLEQAGFVVTMLVHEQPMIIDQMGLTAEINAALDHINHFVFPAELVRERFVSLFPIEPERTTIRPQGCYTNVNLSEQTRETIRASLGVTPGEYVVLGLGYADLRKGFDLFLSCSRLAQKRSIRSHFVWIGNLAKSIETLRPEIDAAIADGSFHLVPLQDDVAPYLVAADVFFLSSREDPFPSAVIEALHAGLPIVAFDSAGGIPELIRKHDLGRVVGLADTDAAVEAIVEMHAMVNSGRRVPFQQRLLSVVQGFAYSDYVWFLLGRGPHAYFKISVVVPNYNYAIYLKRRLDSIFAQTYPIFEIIVLDDCSSDSSMKELVRIKSAENRDFMIVSNDQHVGSVFKQWRKAADMAQGDFIWIAEADDEADPRLLERLTLPVRTNPDVLLAYADSRAIDEEGGELSGSYKGYCDEAATGMFHKDFVLEGREFVRRCIGERNVIFDVSSALLRRTTLLAALDSLGPDLYSYQFAGDWRVYVEMLADTKGSVAYIAQPLNVHRRHSTTSILQADRHVAEIREVQQAVQNLLGPDEQLAGKQAQYLKRVAQQLGATQANDDRENSYR